MSDAESEETPTRPFLAEGIGMLIALMDEGTIDHRRVADRLRRLQQSDVYASLPEDLREITGWTE
jgi:hypothetical protein